MPNSALITFRANSQLVEEAGKRAKDRSMSMPEYMRMLLRNDLGFINDAPIMVTRKIR